jgi:hypothetical protein
MMNRFCKGVRVAALTLLLAAGSATVASAQTGGGTGGTSGSSGGTNTTDTRTDQGFNLGWLGLLGLVGLVPLFLRRNGNTTSHTGGNYGRTNP